MTTKLCRHLNYTTKALVSFQVFNVTFVGNKNKSYIVVFNMNKKPRHSNKYTTSGKDAPPSDLVFRWDATP